MNGLSARARHPPGGSGSWTAALVCFGFSGASALLFQTAWTQQLSLVFGASELAVISVLAAFMAGLAVGSQLGGRWASRARRPLLVYGVVEAGIGIYALALPAILGAADWAQRHFFTSDGFDLDAGLGARTAFQLAGATLLLMPPTLLMGASLPLLVQSAVHRQSLLGFRVGALYATNTLGAALGALLTGYVLLPRLGLGHVLYVGVALNLGVACLALLVARREAPSAALVPDTALAAKAANSTAASANPASPRPRWPLALAALTGALALSLELLWTRLLTFALGGSIYSFATMLATFLLAIALGTVLATRFAGSAAQAARALAAFLLLAGVSCPLALAGADRLPRVLEAVAGWGDPLLLATLFGAALMLPGALAFGACFPLAVRAASREARSAAAATGAVLAANTAGAVVGVAATGLYLLPRFGILGLTKVVAALALSAALGLALALRPRRPASSIVAGIAIVAMATLFLAPPATPWNLLRMSPTAVLAARERAARSPSDRPERPRFSAFGPVVFAGVGRSATVLLHHEGLEWRMTSNGLPESAVQPPGGRVARYAVARWLTLLPCALRPEIARLLVIGLGAGHSVEGLPASIGAIDVVELEPEIVRANREVAPFRRSDPLADPRLALHLGDGRSALALHRELFDAIVSQPSHPWTAGSASLFTGEFFGLVRSRLAPGGIFVQWIGLDFVDVALLRTLVATLRSAFPFVECYRPYPGGAVLFVASDRPLSDLVTARRSIARDNAEWGELGVLSVEDLMLAKVLDDNGGRRFAVGAETSSDLRNLLQTRSPRILGRPPAPADLDAALSPFDALRDLPRELDGAYVVRRLLEQEAPARALRVATELRDNDQRRAAFRWLDDHGYAPLAGSGARSAAPPVKIANAANQQRTQGATNDAPDWPAAAVADARRALESRDNSRWPELDARLAEVDARHPLREAATRARIEWRLQSGDRSAAAAAVPMLDSLLARKTTANDLLLRGALGLAAEDRWVGFAALDELAKMLADEGPERALSVDRARHLLRRLSAAPTVPEEREEQAARELESILSGLLPTASGSPPLQP